MLEATSQALAALADRLDKQQKTIATNRTAALKSSRLLVDVVAKGDSLVMLAGEEGSEPTPRYVRTDPTRLTRHIEQVRIAMGKLAECRGQGPSKLDSHIAEGNGRTFGKR